MAAAVALFGGLLIALPGARADSASEVALQKNITAMSRAIRNKDQVKYVRALTVIANEWPNDLDKLNPDAIFATSRSGWKKSAKPDDMIAMYEALLGAHWTYLGAAPAEIHIRYLRLLLSRQELSRARGMIRDIHSPRLALSLKSDRRCDPLFADNGQPLDVDALMSLQVTDWESAVKRYPGKFEAWTTLTQAYLEAGLDRQVMALTDQLLAALEKVKSPKDVFEDAIDLNWIHDYRSDALVRLGDLDGAEREMRIAAGLPENGHENVSNVLNLANFLAERGSAQAALEVLDAFDKSKVGMSNFGRITAMRARHIAALASGDSTAAGAALDYIRAHGKDSRQYLVEELIRIGSFDEATSVYVEWLNDLEQRWAALAEVQEYADVPVLPAEGALQANFRLWLARDDVRAAIEKVGRIQKVSWPRPQS